VLQCVAASSNLSALQCASLLSSVLQCVAVRCSALQCVAERFYCFIHSLISSQTVSHDKGKSDLHTTQTSRWSVLQRIEVCCSALKCVAAH